MMGHVIVVSGEALIDLVIGVDASVEAVIGGAPYNTARAAARLGADVRFVGGLSADRFGQRLTDQLVADGVRVDRSMALEMPTTLAAAEIDANGAASYRFYFAGTSAPELSSEALAAAFHELDGAGSNIFFTGGLALVLEPMATVVRASIANLPPTAVFVLDVNCRPAVIDDRDAFVANVVEALPRADIVKVSDDDLEYLYPGVSTSEAAQRLVEGGASVVVVTAGSEKTIVIGADQTTEVLVPPISGGVVDTIGAGDTFGAGLIAWWSAAGLDRNAVSVAMVEQAVAAGHAAAAVVVTRRGADPPHLADLHIDWPTPS